MPAPQRGHSVPQSQLPQGSSRSPRQVTPAHAPATQVGSDSRIKLQFDPLTHRLRVQHPSIEGIPLRSAANTLEEGGNDSVFHTEMIGAFFTAVSGEKNLGAVASAASGPRGYGLTRFVGALRDSRREQSGEGVREGLDGGWPEHHLEGGVGDRPKPWEINRSSAW